MVCYGLLWLIMVNYGLWFIMVYCRCIEQLEMDFTIESKVCWIQLHLGYLGMWASCQPHIFHA